MERAKLFADRICGKIEDDRREHAEVREERIHRAERALRHALLHDAADGAGHRGEREQRVAIEVRASFGDLAQHDGRKERMIADETGDARDDAIDFLRGGARAGGNRLHALGRGREGAPKERAVQALFALKVVMEHRLVHAGAAGDAIDAGAGEPAGGEFDRGGGEDAIGGDAGGARHSRCPIKLTS